MQEKLYLCAKLCKMEKCRLFLIAIIAALALSSCTPEFSQIAEYKDITIVFGLLNINEDTQYVKIQKAYLTEGNAYEEARNPENLYYYDKIDVSMNELEMNGRQARVIKNIPLYMTTAVPKDEGVFANPEQVLYYTTEKLSVDHEYQLVIKNKESGKVVTGQTAVVGDFSVVTPISSYLNMTNPKSVIKFYAAQNAVAYDLYMIFRYIEKNRETGEIVKHGVIRWKIGSLGEQHGSTVILNYLPVSFYSIVAANLEPDPTVYRYAYGECLDIEISAAGESYKTYLDVNAPSSSIVQDKLEFTNMETEDGTAYGIFSSRNITVRTYGLHSIAEDSLVRGSITRHLGFRKFTEM